MHETLLASVYRIASLLILINVYYTYIRIRARDARGWGALFTHVQTTQTLTAVYTVASPLEKLLLWLCGITWTPRAFQQLVF